VGRPSIVIVTPALADANNGNWQTARRWMQMLSAAYRVRLAADWIEGGEALMIALHARKSAPAALRWKTSRPHAPLILVMTGTDLYRDIQTDATARACMACADRVVVLNELGVRSLPAAIQPRASVLLQSCPPRRRVPKTQQHLRALMVGHLRDEKSPQTYFEAAERLRGRPDILLDHIGAALDPALGARALALMSRNLEARSRQAGTPNYRWLGGLPHAQTRRRIQAAHVLVHPSRMEGGAHVVIEAVTSGTPVLASRIDGNVGLLGAEYPGFFETGDSAALARLLQDLRDEPDMLRRLQAHCDQRRECFEPAHERAGLQALVADLLQRAAAPAISIGEPS
jgi:putative glycosyltransferase (TIGR04348 family)